MVSLAVYRVTEHSSLGGWGWRVAESWRLRNTISVYLSAKPSRHHPARFSSRRYSITNSTVPVLARYSGPPGRSKIAPQSSGTASKGYRYRRVYATTASWRRSNRDQEDFNAIPRGDPAWIVIQQRPRVTTVDPSC